MSNVYALVLAGGSGVRLWPRSREELPKQFLSLGEGGTLLQETMSRMLRVLPPERLYAVAGAKWSALVSFQAREAAPVSDGFLIEEPAARNTAPAILLGCETLREKGASNDDVVIVAPSDHLVKDVARFAQALQSAVEAAHAGFMVTLGVSPTRPETGFGYIHCPSARQKAENGYFQVERFVEKPSLELALRYMESGEYFWNGGIFVFTLGTLYREMEQASPDLYEVARKGCASFLKDFETLPSISFDYAVMERASRVAMVKLDAGWSDVGSWDTLYEVLDKDDSSNAILGDAILRDSEGCLVDSRYRLTALVDAKDLIVVDSPDALFITKRDTSQKVRGVVEKLKADGRKEAVQAPESARPWGAYRILCEEDRFKIKRIVITPGRRLSLQYHHHRSEHWIVVRGAALVEIDGQERFVHEGESVFIPKSARHRLGNPGKVELEIVEIQGGEYLGEDDIVRLDDDFKRT
ncbi:MAG: mannose-1-phosphate guanylyltransferase/mannose-6-phosphate isomerase [Synergistaceae bacterium]|jgi:mannose-1-phosphate guanylyltransferase/mannose-6-phosphate isomerase|nr:mannose-1-phosphate guanylyltransferase/mannose-6-phosphate isomerase [Synergistaceae bacterium]